MRIGFWIGICWGVAALHAAPAMMPVKAWVDRTALYPGDRLHYIVQVEHSPDIEFVQEHVRQDQLSLEPFEILSVSAASRDLAGDRKLFEVKLLLTTYETGHADATIPSFNLFYFRRSQTAGHDNIPAESIAVPPMKIGLRSTLVDTPGAIRDEKPVLQVSKGSWLLPALVGWSGLIAVLIYAGSRAIDLLRTGFWKRKMALRVRKQTLHEAFDEIRQAPVDSAENVEAFYGKASSILRGLAAERVGECGGFAPGELQEALRRSGYGQEPAAAIGSLLEECDLVRYAPDGAERARVGHPRFLQQLAQVIERH